nr:unnamed protein product [Callosobruchus chinensis]
MSRNRSANSTCINDSTTEQLISKVCATFVSQLEEKFDRKLDKIHDKLSEMSKAIGAIRSDCMSQPRVLLATFTSVLKKHAVMSSDKAKLKGTKVLIYEDLIKGTYELLRLAKKKYGPRNVWSSGGSVFVKCGDAKRRILNSEDI